MKLKIITDGAPNGTKITNTDTGEQLENKCTSVNIIIRPTGVIAEVVLLSDNLVFDGEFQVFKTLTTEGTQCNCQKKNIQ